MLLHREQARLIANAAEKVLSADQWFNPNLDLIAPELAAELGLAFEAGLNEYDRRQQAQVTDAHVRRSYERQGEATSFDTIEDVKAHFRLSPKKSVRNLADKKLFGISPSSTPDDVAQAIVLAGYQDAKGDFHIVSAGTGAQVAKTRTERA